MPEGELTKRRVRVKATKTKYTFAYLRSVSWTCLKRAKESIHGRNLFIASSMVFSAFSIEAYLNHLGRSVTEFCDSVERKLSPREKLNLLASVLRFHVDYGSRPFQTFVDMFAFRNALAHGRTESLTQETLQFLSEDEVPELPRTKWEESISLESADRYLADSKEIVLRLNSKANLEPLLLWSPDTAEWEMAPIDDALGS
jgi:hypothetical protein